MVRPEVEREYQFTGQQLGMLDAAFNLTYTLGQIPGGVVCDMFGPHLFLGVIIALWSLALPLTGYGGFWGIGTGRLVFGAAQAGCYPSLAKVTRLWIPVGQRTSLQGLIASFFGRGGGAISTLVFGFLLGAGMPWRVALIVMGVVGVIFAGLFIKLCRNSPDEDPLVNDAERDLIREGEMEAIEAPPVLPASVALKNSSMRWFVIQQYMNAGADFVYSTLMGSYFVAAHNVEDKVILGLLASLPLFGGAVGGIAGGIINDVLIRRTGSRKMARRIVGCAGKILATIFLFLAVTSGNPMTGAWLLFVTKFFSDWTQPTVWGTSTDLGGRYSATVFSIINASGCVGGVVTPIIAGYLLDRFTTELKDETGALVPVVNYQPVFLLVGLMYLLSAACWLLIDSTDSLERQAEEARFEPS
jgi:ACS family glucarate transporter-like MFS transporter